MLRFWHDSIKQIYWLLLKSIIQRVSMLSSCLNGFKPAVIHMNLLVVKEVDHQHPLEESSAHDCRTMEDNEIWVVNPLVLWDSVVIRIIKGIMMTMLAAGGHFLRKSWLSSAQQAPLQHTCVWFTEALIRQQPTERDTNCVVSASTVIDSDIVFDRKHTIKRDF